MARGRRTAGALEPWLLGAAIGAWVGGFDILYACQDLEFDRAHGLQVDPGALRRRAIAAAVARDARGRRRLPRRRWPRSPTSAALYLAGVGLVAVLLVYEQSLVSEDDLSQVKRAFDLNGYVGILYFVATAASIYVR